MTRLAYRTTRFGLLLGGIATAYGCSSDGGGGAPPSLMDAASEAAGDNCPYGGLELVRGVDGDRDGALTATEVTSTEYVCNGSPATLLTTESLVAGDTHCAGGGMVIHRGADTDVDGVLDAAEVSADEYVCNAVVTSEAGVCVFPAGWDAATASCITKSDWASSDLSGRVLANSYLAGMDLSGANLTGADLSWTELRGSDLSGATLTNAKLGNASLEGANLSNAVLDGADLSGVDLRGANLNGVSASGLAGCPEDLPGGWTCADLGAAGRTLLSPNALLDGLNLTGADLGQAELAGVQAIHLGGCPAVLPQGWSCVDLGGTTGMALVGPGADLSGLDLTSADFSSLVSLNGVQFDDANLSGATFAADANLEDADFSGANLNGATFGNGANLQDATFDDATLTGVNFGTGADLSDATFDGANLTGATLNGASLGDAQLEGATLTGLAARSLDGCPASLPDGWDCVSDVLIGPGATLPGVDLNGADLRDVDLTSANLTGADLTDVDLSGVTISSANFTDADLTDANLSGVTAVATVWDNTTCPNGDNSDTTGNTCL